MHPFQFVVCPSPQFVHFAFDFLDLGQFSEVCLSLHFTQFGVLETVVLSVTKYLAIFAQWNFIFPWRLHFYYMIAQVFYIINVFVVSLRHQIHE